MKYICITKYLHCFTINKTCIFHRGCGKYSNLWCSSKWKMDLQVKKMKVNIVTKAKLSPRSLHHPQGKKKLLIPLVKGEDYENLFPNELL